MNVAEHSGDRFEQIIYSPVMFQISYMLLRFENRVLECRLVSKSRTNFALFDTHLLYK